MFGLYRYHGGLEFMNIISDNYEKLENYIHENYGNWNAFKIIEIRTII